ncbi:hypothetical protein [Pseudarthrobacter sp. MDT3-1]
MKISRYHLAGYLMSGAARLRDHIERIDEGVAYAVDDLALVLRLMVSGARGGELISRTAQSYDTPLPKFGVSPAPEPVPGLVWGAGAIPTTDTLGAGNLLDISQIRFKTALRIQPGAKRVDFTWDKLIRDYANYWGTHVGDNIRDDMPAADRIGTAAGVPLVTYMLREVAVAAWYSAQFVLRHAILQDDPTFFADIDLTDGEQNIWVAPQGGIDEPPRVRGELGKFQGGINAGLTSSFAWAVEYPPTAGLTLGELLVGGLPYEIKVSTGGASNQSDYDVTRQRTPSFPTEVKVTPGKSVKLTPQLHPWDSTNYMVNMSGIVKFSTVKAEV